MPFGPRLDRPSAVGEEGRPRATSLWVASALVVALSVAVTWASWDPRVVLALLLPVGLVAAGLALLAREDFPAKFFGHLCFLPAACALVGLVPLVFALSAYGFVLLGSVTSLLGVSATWADSATETSVRRTLVQTTLVYMLMWVLGVVLAVTLGFGFGVRALLTSAIGSAQPGLALLAFEAAVTAATLGARAALWGLPVRQLTPRRRRARVDWFVGRASLVLTLATIAGVAASLVTGVLLAVGAIQRAFVLVPGLGVLARLLGSQPVVLALLAVGGVGLGVTALALVVRTLTKRFDRSSARNVAVLAAAVVFLPGLTALIYTMLPGGGIVFLLLALLLTFVGPVLVILALLVAYALLWLDVVPSRSLGPALAAAGLVALSVGAGDAGLAAPYVIATAAGAMVVWDTSSFGLGLTAELGHIPDTRRLELFHGVAAVGVAVVAAGVLTGLAYLLTWVSPSGSVPAATVAVVGAFLVLWPLRG